MSAHETLLEADPVAGPSNRKFGLTLGGLVLMLAVIRWHAGSSAIVYGTLACLGVALVSLGLLAPPLLTWPNRLWLKLGFAMAAVVTPMVMLVIFTMMFVPIALVMRWRGRDQLRLRRVPAHTSYWVERQPPGPAPATMINQF